MQFFRKRVKKRAKKGEIFENLGKNVQNLKIFKKKGSLVHATVTHMKQLEYAVQRQIIHNHQI